MHVRLHCPPKANMYSIVDDYIHTCDYPTLPIHPRLLPSPPSHTLLYITPLPPKREKKSSLPNWFRLTIVASSILIILGTISTGKEAMRAIWRGRSVSLLLFLLLSRLVGLCLARVSVQIFIKLISAPDIYRERSKEREQSIFFFINLLAVCYFSGMH